MKHSALSVSKCTFSESFALSLQMLIVLSEYEPRKMPSKTWRECIKKICEVDPMESSKCGGEMKIISFMPEASVIRQILEHLNLWEKELSQDPLGRGLINEDSGVV